MNALIDRRRVSTNKATLELRSTDKSIRIAVAALLMLAALTVASLPADYSSIHAARLSATRSRGTAQGPTVTPVYDRARSVTQIVSSKGGTVVATAGDGTRFTLIVPPGAVLSAAEVTVTPVAAIDRLPLSGGLAAAVQLEPDGLRLFSLATLVIEPQQPVSPSLETSFSWDQAGDNLHLFPMLPPSLVESENAKGSGPRLNPRGLVFKLIHFSGYAVGSGTDADQAALRQQTSGFEAQFEQRLQAIMQKERSRQLVSAQSAVELDNSQAAATTAEDPDYLSSLDQLHRETYANDISPRMDAALQSRDDRALRCAILKSLSWQRSVDLLGLSGKFYRKAGKKIRKFWGQALDIAVENASRRCSQDYRPEEGLLLMSLARQQELLGFDATAAFQAAVRCAKTELEFDSETTVANAGATIRMHVHALVKIDPLAVESPIGQAPIEYFTFEVTPACGTAAIRYFRGSPLAVVSVNFDLNMRSYGDCETSIQEGSFKVIAIDIEPSTTNEGFDIHCPPAPAPAVFDGSFWTASFVSLHEEKRSGPRSIRITGWERGNGALLARWTSTRSTVVNDVTTSERTAINLWHRPE